LYFPTIVTLSLNSHIVLDFYKHPKLMKDDRHDDEGEPQQQPAMTMLMQTVEEKEAKEQQDQMADQGNQDQDDKNSTSSQRKSDFSLLVQRGSLLILKDQMYTDYYHGITPRLHDVIDESMVNYRYCGVNLGESYERRTRMSLTFRVVEKVIKGKFF